MKIDANFSLSNSSTVGIPLPNVYIRRIILDTQPQITKFAADRSDTHTSDSLTSTLELCLKDSYDGVNMIWSNPGYKKGIEALDNVFINVVQTTNPTATKIWSGVQSFKDMNWKQKEQMTEDGKLALEGTTIRQFSLSELSGFYNASNLHYRIPEEDSLGVSIYNFSKLITFPSDQRTPGNDQFVPLSSNQQHLAYFVFTSLSMNGPPNILQPKLSKSTMGKMCSDIALENGEVVKNASVFVVQGTDRLWNGSFSYRQGLVRTRGEAAYTGFVGSSDGLSPFLNKLETPNNKILDFRILKSITEIPIELGLLEKSFLDQTFDVSLPSPNTTPMVKRSASYFSDLFLSRDAQGSARFAFWVDLKKIIRDKLYFGNIISNNEGLISQILTHVHIKSLKVYRKKVENGLSTSTTSQSQLAPTFSLAPPPDFKKAGKYMDTTPGDMKEISIKTFENSSKSFKKRYKVDHSRQLIIDANGPPNNLRANITLGDGVSTLDQVPPPYTLKSEDYDGIICYTGTDKSSQHLTDGFFKYEIEIVIENKLSQLLQAQQEDLVKDLKDLQTIISVATQKGKTPLPTKPTSRPAHDVVPLFMENKRPYYDAHLRSFTTNFLYDASSNEILLNVDQEFWSTIPTHYVNALLNFSQITFDKENVLFMMQNYLNPISSSLEGFLIVVKMLEALINTYERAIEMVTGVKAPKDERNETQQSQVKKNSAAAKTLVNINHEFRDIYNANISNSYGNMFFDFNENDIKISTPGIRFIPIEVFQTYKKAEIKKLYNSEDSSVEISQFPTAPTSLNTTAYSYFTPSLILGSGAHPIKTTKIDFNPEMLTKLIVGKIGENNNTSVGNSSPAQDPCSQVEPTKLNSEISQLFAQNYNVRCALKQETSAPFVTPKQPLENEGFNEAESIDQIKKNFINKDQIIENEKGSKIFKTLVMNGITNPSTPPGAKLSCPPKSTLSIQNFNPVNLLMKEDMNANTISQLPNQIKALIISQDESKSMEFSAASPLNENTQKTLISKNPFRDPTIFSKSKYLFETICTLEVFIGYERVKFKKALERDIKSALWQPLTSNFLDRAQKASQPIFCRLVPYNNEPLNIRYKEEETLPLLEKYFFIGAPNKNPPLLNPNLERANAGGSLSMILNNAQYQTSNHYMLLAKQARATQIVKVDAKTGVRTIIPSRPPENAVSVPATPSPPITPAASMPGSPTVKTSTPGGGQGTSGGGY